jgi:hypothetical protein
MPNSPDSGAHAPSMPAPPGPPAPAQVVPDLSVLDQLAERPLDEHAAVYERLHTQLQGALNEIDNA